MGWESGTGGIGPIPSEWLPREVGGRQQPERLNSLLREAMKEKNIKDLDKYLFIPTEHCVRGFHYCTDVLLYKPEDVRAVEVYTSKGIDLERYTDGVRALINEDSIPRKPLISLNPSDGKEKVQLRILTKWCWGTYSDHTVVGEKENYAEVWPSEMELKDYYKDEQKIRTLTFYMQKKDGSLAWSYFPTDINSVEEVVAKSSPTEITRPSGKSILRRLFGF